MRVRKISFPIASIAMAVPRRVILNSMLCETLDTSVEWLEEKTGIKSRHVLSPHESTSDLAAAAVSYAYDESGLELCNVDQLLLVTWTPESYLPQTASLIARKLNISPFCVDINAGGCAAGLPALELAAYYSGHLQSGHSVALVTCDAVSKAVDWSDRRTSVFLGDAAGCFALGGTTQSQLYISTFTFPQFAELAVTTGGGVLKWQRRPDPAFEMDGRSIWDFVVSRVPDLVTRFLQQLGDETSVDFVLFHQANIRLVEHLKIISGLQHVPTCFTADRLGNTSSSSWITALCEGIQESKIVRGDNILIITFGAGMTVSLGLLAY